MKTNDLKIVYLLAFLSATSARACLSPRMPLISGSKNRVCDSQLSASSVYSSNHGPANSRLHFKAQAGRSGAWSAQYLRRNEWIQVDLGVGVLANVTAIATQGRHDRNQWVETYKVKYSSDCSSWKDYHNGGSSKGFEFLGNWDQHSVRQHHFSFPFLARCVRVYPQTWHNHISMRWELYGCVFKPSNCAVETCTRRFGKQCRAKYGG